MPRTFEISADCAGSVEKVRQAYREPGYWQARIASYGLDDAMLESLRETDGILEVTTHQVLRSAVLPGLITQVHRGDLSIRRTESWEPVRDGIATAAVEASIEGAPARVTGTARLSPAAVPDSSQLVYQLTVEVRVPLIGGKLENFIGAQLTDLVAAEQRFTTEWITDDA